MFLISFLLFNLLSYIIIIKGNNIYCPPGYTLYSNTYCYFISYIEKSYSTIQNECLKRNGYVVSIDSQNEDDIFDSIIENYFDSSCTYKDNRPDVYLGYTSTNGNNWNWDSQQTTTFTNWKSSTSFGTSRKCSRYRSDSSGWNTADCSNSYAYVCEATPITSPPTIAFCPPNFSPYDKYCYNISSLSVSYTTANARCNNIGGSLVTINNLQESLILSYALDNQDFCKKDSFIGFNSLPNGLLYSWADGSNSNYSDWSDEAGDDDSNDKYCTVMSVSDDLWVPESCSSRNFYICEITPLITPAPTISPAPTQSPPTSSAPTIRPTKFPTRAPTTLPTRTPSTFPTSTPTVLPTFNPSSLPSQNPTANPTSFPTTSPTSFPTTLPTFNPSSLPTTIPTANPTSFPTFEPTSFPTVLPTYNPTQLPTENPTANPSILPSENPTYEPTQLPTSFPTFNPTSFPTELPTFNPSSFPTNFPSQVPTNERSSFPTNFPTNSPTSLPSLNPSLLPSSLPTSHPTNLPTIYEPPVPKLTFARFNSNGVSINVQFDSSTNRAKQNSIFVCSLIFQFIGSSASSCQWTSDSLIIISLGGNIRPSVNDNITIIENKIQAKCEIDNHIICLNWKYIPLTTIKILPPFNPIIPVISLSAPKSIGPCDSPLFDFSSSTGSGGRDWIWKVLVSSSSDNYLSTQSCQNFFDNTYRINSPVSIPKSILVPGKEYFFDIRFCNFFGVCSSLSHNLIVLNISIPIVTIIGTSPRVLLTSSNILIETISYFSNCDGTKSTVGLQYDWKIYEDYNIIQDSIKSIAVDKSKFRLTPYTLKSNKIYKLDVTVTKNSYSSIASIILNITQSKLVAIINGGLNQSIRQGSSLILDGSKSYDPDNLLNTDLNYLWSCQPLTSSICNVNLISNGSKVIITPLINAEINTKSVIILTLTHNNRISQQSITITIIEPLAPIIKLSQISPQNKIFNPTDSLVVSAYVETSITSKFIWSVDDSNIDLLKISSTSIQHTLLSGEHNFNFVIRGNSLIPKISPYTFSLSDESAKSISTISIYVNSPPNLGIFNINPSIGITLITKFSFTTNSWTDNDLPLTFEFGYLTSQNRYFVLRSRSEITFTSTTLPPGNSAFNNTLNCQVKVFDSYNADTSLQNIVIVKLSESSTNNIEFSNKITNLLIENSGDTSSKKQIISVAGGILNSRDCSNAPNCTNLNRLDCSLISNTCGPCKTDYIGTNGDGNSKCLSKNEFKLSISSSSSSSSNSIPISCNTNNDCDLWKECDISTNKCQPKLQKCLNDCSGNGNCIYINSNTNKIITSSCFEGDSTCFAQCECDSNYGGNYCQMDINEFLSLKNLREDVLFALESISNNDEPTASNIESWISNLNSLTSIPNELSETSCNTALSVTTTIIDNINTNKLSLTDDTITNIIDSLDLVSTSSTFSNNERRRLNTLQSSLSSMLVSAVTLQTENLVSGQESINNIKNNFRSKTEISSSNNAIISLPQSTIESATNKIMSQALINNSNQLKLTLSSFKPNLYQNSLNYTSNTIRIDFLDNNVNNNNNVVNELPDITFIIQNNELIKYSMFKSENSFNTTCQLNDYSTYHYNCIVGDIMIPVNHTCPGNNVTMLITKCPIVHIKPICQILNSEQYNCNAISYNSSVTTCSCSYIRNNDNDRRNLADVVINSGLEVVSVSSVVVDEFITTMATANELNSAKDLKKTLIIILLYGILWFIGLSFILIMAIRNNSLTKKVNEGSKSSLETKKQIAKASRSKEDIRQYLIAYVNEVFPAVFQPRHVLSRLWGEISRHHRYIVIFTTNRSNSENIRMLTTIQLLTVQSMLMFILAVCYDLQFPTDDGTCSQMNTASNCHGVKSPFGTTNECEWISETSICKYRNESGLSMKSILIISAVVSMFTAPINLVVDFLFIEILSAPTADSIKVKEQEQKQAQETVVKQVARRASAVGIQVNNRINNISRKFSYLNPNQIQTTRKIPGETTEAQVIAYECASQLLNETQKLQSLKLSERQSLRNNSISLKKQKERQIKLSNKIQNNNNNVNNNNNTLIKFMGKSSNTPHKDLIDLTLDEQLVELHVDIIEQRKLLPLHQQEAFDDKWGIDPCGEFSRHQVTNFFGITYSVKVEDLIKKELKLVRKETERYYQKLKIATDSQIGLELIHLFVLDLLGHNSPVAKIFLTKSETDFQHAMVVTKTVKIFAWIAILLINLFFIYFTMLRGLQRGLEWQRSYAMGCIIQLIIEIFFYETSECAIVNFFIPDLARNEVNAVGFAINQAIHKMCNDIVDKTNYILDAPHYLFISTNLSKKFPQLLESTIIQSYHSYNPGPFYKIWNFSQFSDKKSWWSPSGGNHRAKKFFITSFIIGLLQSVGAMSPTLQRLFIHAIQPLAVSAIVLVWFQLNSHPLWWILAGAILGYLFYLLINQCIKESRERTSSSEITPINNNNLNPMKEIIKANNNNNNNNNNNENKEDTPPQIFHTSSDLRGIELLPHENMNQNENNHHSSDENDEDGDEVFDIYQDMMDNIDQEYSASDEESNLIDHFQESSYSKSIYASDENISMEGEPNEFNNYERWPLSDNEIDQQFKINDFNENKSQDSVDGNLIRPSESL